LTAHRLQKTQSASSNPQPARLGSAMRKLRQCLLPNGSRRSLGPNVTFERVNRAEPERSTSLISGDSLSTKSIAKPCLIDSLFREKSRLKDALFRVSQAIEQRA
jgi:hypothetical protein